jgi:uncharacterized protein (TIGR00369 family)
VTETIQPNAGSIREHLIQYADPAIGAAAAERLSGLEFLQSLVDGNTPRPPITAALDFTLTLAEPGRVVFEITPAELHYNLTGSVHGGVFATLLDSACACAVVSLLPAGVASTSMDLTVKFLRPVTTATGRLRSEGTVTHFGSRTALAQAQLTDEAGKLYAHATSSCLILRPNAGQPA